MQSNFPLVRDQRIGHSQTIFTNNVIAHLYFIRTVVETGSQIIVTSASQMAKHVAIVFLLNLFAKFCQKQRNSKPQNHKKRTVNTFDEEPHPEDSVNFLQSQNYTIFSIGADKIFALIQNNFAKKP